MNNANNIYDRPLDHATARIVTELAAAILEPLKEDIKKTVYEAIELKIGPSNHVVAQPETPETSDGLQKLLRTISEDVGAWEGILKAEGVAQTKELSEFSSEISDLVKDIKSSLISALDKAARGAFEKDVERGERLRKFTELGMSALEKRLLKLEKIALVSGVILALTAFLLIVAIARTM
jgi:hypothetical protein